MGSNQALRGGQNSPRSARDLTVWDEDDVGPIVEDPDRLAANGEKLRAYAAEDPYDDAQLISQPLHR